MDFCSYNVRGLNSKIPLVRDFLLHNKINLFGLIETRVQKNVAKKISSEINRNFCWIDNYDFHHGGRIWVGWNPFFWDIKPIAISSQHITCYATQKHLQTSFVVTFIYGFNKGIERRQLWVELLDLSRRIGDMAWVLTGDFNVCLDTNEKQGGSVCWKPSMEEFKDCIMRLGLTDLRFSGQFFTWWDCHAQCPKFRKLDRVMVNNSWLLNYDLSTANFLTRGFSDHCPAVIDLGVARTHNPKPFKCFDYLCDHPLFMSTVSSCWTTEVTGDPWYILTSKLKLVKAALKSLNHSIGDLHSRVNLNREVLASFQQNLQHPAPAELYAREQELIAELKHSLDAEESFLKQKSRVHWLKLGDSNSKFFFNSCKNRWNINKIIHLMDSNGVAHSSHQDISAIAVDYFKGLFGSSNSVVPIPDNLLLPGLSAAQSQFLSRPFTAKDVFESMKSMPRGKSPGPDGFTTEFFLTAWSIVGTDVENAVNYFFRTGYMPRIINSAAVALVPKVQNPTSMRDFRPISCCNTIYKCISKMLSSRLQLVLKDLISPFQSAFIPGRSIGDNVLLVQALCKDYHKSQGPPRCAIKIDIHKAFDTLSWDFIFEALRRMHFPEIFIGWVHSCISSAMFSIKVNGSLEGYFKGASGLRQGDPLSPYLFVIAMEVLTASLQASTSDTVFNYHWRTKEIQLNHLIFADDIFFFCKGDISSVQALVHGLHKFSSYSGLKPN